MSSEPSAEKLTPPDLNSVGANSTSGSVSVSKPIPPFAENSPPVARVAIPIPPPLDAASINKEGDISEVDSSSGKRFLIFNAMPSWFISLIFHLIIFVILGLVYITEDLGVNPFTLIVGQNNEQEDLDDIQSEEILDPSDSESFEMQIVQMQTADTPLEVVEIQVVDAMQTAPADIELNDFSEQVAPKEDLMKDIGSLSSTAVSGRSADSRAELVKKYGGSKGSEEAVAQALQWLAEHQNQDGSWSFEHRLSPRCQGRCKDAGLYPPASRNASTAMALLPFLGAGQTHKSGKYQKTVGAGLEFLVRNIKKSNHGGSLSEFGGFMYAHGLASITLCEAYAMTNDQKLYLPAQSTIDYIVYAQDPSRGGWRYGPREPGDTSVVGWQLMALKSAHMGSLFVPEKTVRGASRFLDSVQIDYGSQYGYMDTNASTPALTSVGLLSRMYLGWKKEYRPLQRGVKLLSTQGPSKTDLYYNYYATQVMRHYEGDEWKKWNSVMRDQLVKSQDKTGHQKGSWYIPDTHAAMGGRLYCTSLATMILEVYYRHLPIYQKEASEDDFKL